MVEIGLQFLLLHRCGREENRALIATYSRTVYVGNIGYCTTDRQIYEFFSRVGPVEVVHMGLNRIVRERFRACSITKLRFLPIFLITSVFSSELDPLRILLRRVITVPCTFSTFSCR